MTRAHEEHRTPPLPKLSELEPDRQRPEGTILSSDQGVKIVHTDDSLKAGARGPTLMEDGASGSCVGRT
jgi:hypothetical protein